MNSLKAAGIIYHYCTLSTIESILSNRTLRLSDITKSNDSAELTWLLQWIQPVFEAVYNVEVNKKNEDLMSTEYFEESVKSLVDMSRDKIKNGYMFYVMCFSTHRDLLSQWQGYADDAKGISIGISLKGLKEICEGLKEPIGLKKVEYLGRYREKADILTLLDRHTAAMDKELKKVRKVAKRWLEEKRPLQQVTHDVLELLPFYKNSFFDQEDEYRICRVVSKKDISTLLSATDSKFDFGDEEEHNPFLGGIHYKVSEDGASSYVDLHIPKMESIIRDIIIGPKCSLSKEEMKMILRQYGFDPSNIDVRYSGGTYQ